MAERLTVFVADDHPVYRDGVVAAIKSRAEFELVGIAPDGRAALEQIRDLRPDVAVLDMKLPGLEGIEVLEALRNDGFDTRILFVSGFLENDVVYRALGAGASGYLTKEADRDQICDAVAAVARGETRVAPEAQARLASAIRTREVSGQPLLSEREREVLKLTADGLSGPEVAGRLHLSAATVKTHLQNVYAKLEVSDRAAAVAVAMRKGLLD
jgi:two-component system nitrate/nitrite response regulator NarL